MEIGAGKSGRGQVRHRQIGIGQVGALEIGARQVSNFQARTDQVGAGQAIGVNLVDHLAGEGMLDLDHGASSKLMAPCGTL